MLIDDFTYDSYSKMIELLKNTGYKICLYDELAEGKQCILRHDIDFDIKKSLELAKLECKLGVKSTYFVLLKTDFYNPLSKKSIDMLREIIELGHCIGLHFDEKSYDDSCDIVKAITNECSILGQALNYPIKVVSMHRPSKKTLESNYVINGIINSYSLAFFKGYKYISDSRRCWRENIFEIIENENYSRLHILTHAFWYNERTSNIKDSIVDFINEGESSRLNSLKDNITDLDGILA